MQENTITDIDEVASGMDAFPAYIYKFKFDFQWNSIRDKVSKYIEDTNKKIKENGNPADPENDGGITSAHWNSAKAFGEHPYGLPHTWDEFKDYYKLMEFIQPLLCKKWGYNPGWERHISESWINKHPKGGWTGEHHHQGAMFATTAYLNMPKNGGHFLIKNPLEMMKKSEPTDVDYWNGDNLWAPIEVETNDVLIFPGWVTHKTEVNNSDDDRYILSTNFITMRPLHDMLNVVNNKNWV